MTSTVSEVIPLSVPNLSGRELEYVEECLKTGWISTAGEFVGRFESKFAHYLNVEDAVSTVNGTAALHLALRLVGVEAGDLVIMPNVTFVASANAISYTGATPVLVDIEPDSWQMDLELLLRFLSESCETSSDGCLVHRASRKRVAALMIVHVQGHMCDMERLLDIAHAFGLPVIEDAAEALGATYKGKQAGTLGDVGCFSFNGNKIISTGGGGMVTAKTASLVTRARHLATTAKTDPLRYFHDEVGYNYRLVNVLAAIGVAQMEQLESFVSRKREIAAKYERELDGIGDISFQSSNFNVQPNHWLFTICTARMQPLLDHINGNSIMARPFWVPMNQLPMYQQCEYVSRDNVSKKIHQRALSLPCSTNIEDHEIDTVVATIKAFYSGD